MMWWWVLAGIIYFSISFFLSRLFFTLDEKDKKDPLIRTVKVLCDILWPLGLLAVFSVGLWDAASHKK